MKAGLPGRVAVIVLLVVALGLGAFVGITRLTEEDVPGFREQACALPSDWLELTQRGFFEPRSGQVSLIPRTPAYMSTGPGGWSHSGPWPYLQDVPLVFYGPGVIDEGVTVARPVDLADIAPTFATLMKGGLPQADGESLDEVAVFDEELIARPNLKLIVTIVWDGGGWNTLEQWPDDWPNLREMMEGGVSYTNATTGSSPSVTPAIHTTIGTGSYPSRHGVTGVPVRDEEGEVVDSFLDGESSRFIQIQTLGELWDSQHGNEPLVGMVAYEPWHLGMIGKGAELTGGDKDHAAWLDVETNEWIANQFYELPDSLVETGGLEEDIAELDAADGRSDGAWGPHEILEDPTRTEETPAFIRYHTRAMLNLISQEGYGEDELTDLLYTNYKQIDRVGHYFNMASEEVHDSLIETDRQLGVILEFLEDEIGTGNYVVALTADHGQQPDAGPIDGYAIDPNEVKDDIAEEFGPIVRAVWPTEVFLHEGAMEERGISAEDVARYLSGYRLRDNVEGPAGLFKSAGSFGPSTRLFDLAIPAEMLPGIACAPG